MTDTIVAASFIAVIASIFVGIFCYVEGIVTADNEWKDRCERAGIKLVEHKSLDNGVITTNWVEVVHLK